MTNTLRRRAVRTAVSALLAIPALALVPLTAHADALDNITKAGVLKVAVPEDYPPFGAVGADMKPQGYDIDTAALLAKSLGVKLELVPVNSANRVPYLTTNKVDLVISSLGKTPDREKVMDFSAPYAPYFQGVFGPAKVKVTGKYGYSFAKSSTGLVADPVNGVMTYEKMEYLEPAPDKVAFKNPPGKG